MNRREFLVRTGLATAGAALPLSLLSAGVVETFTPLRRKVGYFTDRGGTIGWLATDEALAVVDSQYPEPAERCLNGLKERSGHALDLLVNTHHHGDHTAGNAFLAGAAGSVVAHENVPALMQQSAGDEQPPPVPDTTYRDSWQRELGDEILHLKYYGPGHTGGDSVVYFEKAGVVHMGDLVFNRMNPYTDRPAGASVHNWITILDEVRREYPSDTIYIFGHGKPEYGVEGSEEDVKVMRDYLAAMVAYVRREVEAGRSREEITDIQVMEGFEQFQYADFWTLSQNLGVVYEEVMEQ